ncbi:glycosyltransferase [Octadecabacter sp. B2R22]|uniref:glycosyltransferase family protein n=1 Tax=Octadecabacter sp. B2R22 TaxID=2841570 RepID=UPI001C0A5A8E|nr:glycosyltransferase [Octadecabacter sp. B2R22]MBU2994101.1 glycosyltransferase [Octadecabacter sp. B2R22]
MIKATLGSPDLSKLETYFKTNISGDPTKATIAVPLTWPDIKNAEYEVIKRFCIAAENIGSKIIVTDNNGYPVWASDDSPVDDSRPLGRDDVDFVLSLHFESPRLTDVYSYYAIWQPVSFYFDFGYEASVEKLMTHNDALSCSSDMADAHVRTLMGSARPQPPKPFPYLFHSPAEPYFEPNITADSRLFYIGINWERLGSTKGRHHELLRLLDEEDLIDIYGPRVFLGKRPWEGFDTYRGEIPFDGTSVVRALAGSGICLAMSSHPHQESGVMSNRLFEGLAAGAAMIANPHSIVDKYFSDVVYEIDDTLSDEEIFFQVKGIIEDIRRDPAAANERARVGQERMREFFSLEKSLQALINQHEGRAKTFAKDNLATTKSEITVVFPYRGHRLVEAANVIKDLAEQVKVKLHLVFVCDQAFADGAGKQLVAGLGKQFASATVVTDVFGTSSIEATTGQAFAAALPHIKTDQFALVRTGERFFSEHFSGLARRLSDNPTALVAASGKLEESFEGTVRDRFVTRKVAGLGFSTKTEQLLTDDNFSDTGRFVFKRSVLDTLRPEFLALLDGLEVVALLIGALKNGGLQQNGIASYVAVTADLETHRPSKASFVRQRQFLRDMMKFDPEMNTLRDCLEPIGAQATKSGGEASLYYPRMFIDDIVDLRKGSDALKYLGSGFSYPEDTAIWVDGLSATLRFRLGDVTEKDKDNLKLSIGLAGRPATNSQRPQHCTISVNGVTLGYYALNSSPTQILVTLPLGALDSDTIRLRLTADHAERVLDEQGAVLDPRELSVLVSSIGIIRAQDIEIPKLSEDMDYDMRRGGSGLPLLVSGGYVEPDLVWLTDGPAKFSFSVPDLKSSTKLSLYMSAVDSEEQGDDITMTCSINDTTTSEFVLTDKVERYDILLDPEMAGSAGVCHLELHPSHAKRARGKNRVVSAGLEKMRLSQATFVEVDTVYKTVTNEDGLQFLSDGFSSAEDRFTWIDGDRAVIDIQFKADDEDLELVLAMSGRDLSSGDAHQVIVTVNGEKLETHELKTSIEELVTRLPASVFSDESQDFTVEISLKEMPEMVFGADQTDILDSRRLGANISSFAIRTASTDDESS